MLVPKNRLLVRVLLLISFLTLSSIILRVAHIRQNGGCSLRGTETACEEVMIQGGDGDGVTVAGGRGGAAEVVVAPFRRDEPKSVVILAYQRTGSSLFGRMFNSNQDNVFYLFEPLDAIYSAMYGTATGWNVPSDITNYGDGSVRTVPERELTGVSELMRSIFSCDVDRLPTQLLYSPFLRGFPKDFSTLDEYVSCLDRYNLTNDSCRSSKQLIEKFCGRRFGEASEETLTKCYRLNSGLDTYDVSSEVRQSFSEYSSCMKRLREETDRRNCSRIFRETCRRRPVRVIKSVRATMQSLEPLLSQLPNLRVIHLIRDPRGVAVSRKNFHQSVRGRFSEGATDQLAREAQLYCQSVVRDIRTRLRLEKSFPGRILPVVYDDFVRDMTGYVGNVYRFLDMEVPNSTLGWVRKAGVVGNGRNATDLASAWQDSVSFRISEEVVHRCRELFSLVADKLPL